jgi:hypothetical protein
MITQKVMREISQIALQVARHRNQDDEAAAIEAVTLALEWFDLAHCKNRSAGPLSTTPALPAAPWQKQEGGNHDERTGLGESAPRADGQDEA